VTPQIQTDILIDASPSQVWQTIADFGSYPEWNPFVRRISGSLDVGSRLDVELQPPSGKGMTIRPTVLPSEPGRELRWIGSVGVPGIFDGEHRFRIEPLGPDRVRFVHEEQFSGILAPLVLRFIRESTRQGFTAMNRALKARAESAVLANA
jgi:hypothetical protein